MQLFKRKVKEKKVEEYEGEAFTIKEDTALYLLLETEKNGMVTYLQSNNVQVKFVSTSVDEITIETIQEDTPYRLIVIDYGLGNFNDTVIRASLLGLIEACSEEDKVTIFTNSSELKQDLIRFEDKVDVYSYNGVLEVLAALRMYPEQYVFGGAKDFTKENLQDFQGKQIMYDSLKNLFEEVELDLSSTDGECVESFNVKY